MDEQSIGDRVDAVELRTKRLERWLKLTNSIWVLTVVMLLVCAWKLPQAAQQSNTATDLLRVRKLVVVDEKGTERIVLASPVPDPQVMGKRWKRRSPGSGIMLNDAKGNERAGFGMLDDGSMMVGLDDESGGERAHLYYIPKRGSGLLIQGEKEGAKISLLIPPGAEPTASPKLEMTDRAGKATASLPSPK